MLISSASAVLLGVVVISSLQAVPIPLAESGSTQPTDEFRRAERLYWLDNWVNARPLYADCEKRFAASDPSKALICKFSRLRADAETNLSYSTVSRIISRDLETVTARTHPEVRLHGLIVKATADLSTHDPVLSGQEWEQAEELAHSLKENGWVGRAKGELGIVAYLRGDTAKAVTLNTESFQTAKELQDVAGRIRAFALKGVGLLERNAGDQALSYFDQALELAENNPDARFPLMAYMGTAQALESQGDTAGASRLLAQANEFVERVGMTVYKADLATALGIQVEKHGILQMPKQNSIGLAQPQCRHICHDRLRTRCSTKLSCASGTPIGAGLKS
jgi:tetratricopeptide (TPR) repeat protein